MNQDHLHKLVNEMRDRLDALAEEVVRLAQEQEEAPGERGAPMPEVLLDRTGFYDLTRVIPPTRSDEPDSIVGGFATRDFADCCAVGSDERFYCTGTLIAPNVVVTARHCKGVTRVFLRGYDVDIPEDGEILRVRKQFDHPSDDLRVLVLEGDSSVKPRRVARGAEVRADTALAVGFGTIDFGGMLGYGIKRLVEVPVVSLGCESKEDADKYGCRMGTEMVAGHRGLNRDSCRGDSGGPLYIMAPEGGYYLLGATSRGAKTGLRMCGDGGIYVRIDQFLDWVRDVTGVDIE